MRTVSVGWFVVLLAIFSAPTARAQTWEVEAHISSSSATLGTGGSGALPSTGALIGGQISAATFFFGDGATLFNQNLRAVGAPQNALIAPLDTALGASGVRRNGGPTVGVRLERALPHRLAIQISGDLALDHLVFDPAVVTSLEAARSSYVPALQRALSVFPAASTVAASDQINDRHSAPQLFGTAVLVYKLRAARRVVPFVVGGGGVMASQGSAPSATLTGTYAIGDMPQLFGSDSVRLTYAENATAPVYVGGGGFTVSVSPRLGLHVDAREHVFRNSGVTSISVTPSLSYQSSGQAPPFLTNGALEFAPTAPLNEQSISTSIFSASGLQRHFMLAAGAFIRF